MQRRDQSPRAPIGSSTEGRSLDGAIETECSCELYQRDDVLSQTN